MRAIAIESLIWIRVQFHFQYAKSIAHAERRATKEPDKYITVSNLQALLEIIIRTGF